jgi:ubiquinone/menaquinone biosynthesis C-methylase UbiE
VNWAPRFARFVTQVVVRMPWLWRVFRPALSKTFDRLAPTWDMRSVDQLRLGAIALALDAVERPPGTVLDLGTGTGAVARNAAERWPDAEITGADVSPGMVEEARRRATSARQRYDVADASRLPYADGAFDLVALNNMIPFFDELARVTAPGGHVAIAFSRGPETPIWVPLDRVRAELERRNFPHITTFSNGPGQSLLARKGERA